jgi:hypothetical protein
MKGLQQSNNLLRRLNRTLYQVDRWKNF